MIARTYEEALHFLSTQLPMYSRVGAPAYNKSLDKTLALCEAAGNPHLAFKSIHVAGTNGKGSTSSMLAAVLQSAEYKVGLHTSPHLKDYRERTRINGEMITGQQVLDFVNRYEGILRDLQPSFFEMSVVMAFEYFAQQAVDIAVIEVGLGGRLDSTNVITPLLAVITNVGMDHMDLLGPDVASIAMEKAGIIKPGVPVVLGEGVEPTLRVVAAKAEECHSPLYVASEELRIQPRSLTLRGQEVDVVAHGHLLLEKLELDLAGVYQHKNVATALLALSELQTLGYNISEEQLRAGLANVQALSGLQGRWQVLKSSPLVIADTAHNEDGLREVMYQLKHTPHGELHFVIGMVADKSHEKLLRLMPEDATYYYCSPNVPRGLPAEELGTLGRALGRQGKAYASCAEAYQAALLDARPDDIVYIGGSTFVVAELL